MVSSLIKADPWLCSDNCIVSYSDIVYCPDDVLSLMRSNGDIVIAYDPRWLDLWALRFDNPLVDAETFRIDGERITEIGARPEREEDIQGQYMGLLKISPEGWNRIHYYLSLLEPDERDCMDVTKLLRGLVESEVEVLGVPIENQWFEIDSEHDLKMYSTVKVRWIE